MKRTKLQHRLQRAKRVRKQISRGTAQIPRLCVSRSNREISVQLIDDVAQITLASAHSLKKENGGNGDAAQQVGSEIAKKAKEKGIAAIVFDRSGNPYQGRVQILADAVRKEGVTF